MQRMRADTRPRCGDVINERKQKFSLVDLIHKVSVPVVLSVAGTLITILSFFSMEGERQMEQTRKLLADAFDKDPIKQQYCIFYIDHLLASGRISAQMTVSVLTTVAANATNDNVRLDALRMMPDLLEQKNYQEELKPFLVRSISGLIPNLTEVEVPEGKSCSTFRPWSRRMSLIETINCRALEFGPELGSNPSDRSFHRVAKRRLSRFSRGRCLQSPSHSRLGIGIERRSAKLIHVRREELTRFVQKVELPRVASAPLAEAAVKAKPQPRAKRQQTFMPFRGQPRDLSAVGRNSPHQIQKLARDPVPRIAIARRKKH